MRLVGIFLWIIVGAIILWFFSLNLNQHVDINLFNAQYQNVNLVTVIFISVFIGVIFGALLLSSQVLKAKTEVASVKKENRKLLKELEGLRNLSIDEIPEADTKIEPDRDL
ncbi:MAG TPA: LapA family protein [Caldithrix abyssi]|uniref:LapA family protein n=1 Tax=Caldithrix abyssi TaxID=187145 RepID=A0A7V4WWB4_CALAY|nr:LapA family protein [Caldithrix abyssi]